MALLVPKRAKFRKAFRGKRGGVASRGTEISFGSFGLKSMQAGWISSRQIEAARRAMTNFTSRGGRIWIRIFPDKPVTKHPAESRMGSGKGDVVGYVAVVKPGTMIFEMGAVSKEVAAEAIRLASHKLPVKTRFITKEGVL
ncbi:50S ribosomal protein L16 [Candidatus Daviesbacteria bacterium RIFCSPLOWO2_02_FULL_40_8]|uniref:Large ribosomal subunit protein uL16 n=1 Tax=Candidatus Daviesbacteria bacterium RIFCSPLOWO2_01_FULL_40_24 TaxID=1797787 RepID=A0A1F5MJY7_9BACT|nr:MAG: 50S ribosomal protein L16 [Candidatus Daviesbacteria bacterium RIFCSPHIGHO2_01_FULL_41_45]OGE35386.1 MAG: 50S ribosomal protein L16 [Candidatus Daviesbacteria bacterium RIFCSPHIGHO2_02_FULL_41_14]OGE65629.1 MAG: 50S ribosomal protein L16 [Candidatus Daviesbacteria bacterium RIFCSPLOWO2_01_FULL_40_24]OGE66308.1 MAG: 50S ribosomal protein L16 [Candidatus Daviesbacteria bacterium RIFCSPLOWO2_02_FULL_40_8]